MKRPLILICLALLLSGCLRRAPLGPSPTPSRTAAPTATATPTRTPTPVPTPTPLPQARLNGGEHALFNGDWETALSEFQQALDSSRLLGDDKIAPAALLGIARARWMERNQYETEQAINALLKEYPLSDQRAAAYFLQAQIRTQQERYAEAADAYTRFLELRPGPVESYIYDLRGDAYFAAQQYPQSVKDFEAALAGGSQLDGTFLRMKMARSYALAEDYPTALTLYDDLAQRTTDENTLALIDLRKGEIYTTLGQTEQANTAHLDAVQNHPTSPYAYTALSALVEQGIKVDELQRGIVDYYAQEYGVAQAAFDRYLQTNPSDPATAYYYYGLTARALGNHAQALERWNTLIADYDANHTYWDDAWEQKAYTQWFYLDQYKEAVDTLLKFVEQAGNHPRAAEFLNDAALVAERDNRLELAADTWDRIVKEYPDSNLIPRALFLAGLARYRLEDYPYALESFQRALVVAPNVTEQAADQLWIAKCYTKLDNPSAAKAALEKAIAADPTGYYSERASDLLYNRPIFDAPLSYSFAYDGRSEKIRAEEWLKTQFNLPAGLDLSGLGALAEHPTLKRGDDLWRLGLYDDARAEFEALRQAVQSDPELSYRLAVHLIDIGAYRSGISTARQVLNLAGMDDAATLKGPAYFNHLRFGPYFGDLVLPLAKEYNFHPLFIFSVIRQESLFEGFVRSSAGANGLMQIMPATGEGIVQDLGWPENYSQEDLVRPLVNLHLGVDYLDEQRRLFDGDLYAALAAYNSGPGNAMVWKELSHDDPDLFLEVIRYPETRDYVRKIYEIFAIYRWLYEEK